MLCYVWSAVYLNIANSRHCFIFHKQYSISELRQKKRVANKHKLKQNKKTFHINCYQQKKTRAIKQIIVPRKIPCFFCYLFKKKRDDKKGEVKCKRRVLIIVFCFGVGCVNLMMVENMCYSTVEACDSGDD